MRGADKRSGELFSYVDLEKRARKDASAASIREMTDTALAVLSGDFAALCSGMGRPSIAPEKLLRAMLCFTGRAERLAEMDMIEPQVDRPPRHHVPAALQPRLKPHRDGLLQAQELPAEDRRPNQERPLGWHWPGHRYLHPNRVPKLLCRCRIRSRLNGKCRD